MSERIPSRSLAWAFGLVIVALLPAYAAYTYYLSDTFSSINTTRWQQNGTLSGSREASP